MTRDDMPANIEAMLQEYESAPADSQAGMKTELMRYAQDHPELMIDRSGNNLKPSDRMFHFYNPRPDLADTNDNWFPNDPRNNPDSPDFEEDRNPPYVAET